MEQNIEKYKGIHPGLILERELKKRNLKKGPFAIAMQEYPQVINEVTKARRGMTPGLSLKIDKALGLEKGTMLILQAWYEIEQETQKARFGRRPDLSMLRKALFWDTDIDKIDWDRQYRAVIQRVFERGNNEEKQELLRFYGEDKVRTITGSALVAGNTIPIMPHLKVR